MSRFLLCMCFLTLAACSGKTAESIDVVAAENAVDETSAEFLFEKATTALKEQKYREATISYNEVERQHPYSNLATRAQIMSAYASYQDENYDEAIIALNRFIELHPGNEKVDYAYYLKALSYYDQISDVRRDQQLTEQALNELNRLLTQFPDSEYSRDATLKQDLVFDHLAGKEMEIGRYYLHRGHVNAALNRFRVVIQDYQTTTHTAEALYRLVEGYLILGIRGEARSVAGILGHNYPGNEWYERAYNLLDDEAREELIQGRSVLDKTIDSIFKPE